MITPEQFADIKEFMGKIDARTSEIKDGMTRLASKESVDSVNARVDKLESEAVWAKRSAFSAIFAAVLAFFRPHLGV